MMTMTTTIEINNTPIAYIEALRVDDGVDGTHTYHWEWGIEHNGYQRMDDGDLQHKEADGTITLLAKVLERIRGRKADK